MAMPTLHGTFLNEIILKTLNKTQMYEEIYGVYFIFLELRGRVVVT